MPLLDFETRQMDPVRGIMKNGMKVAPIVLSVCKSPLKIATRQWARMTKIDVLFSGREKPLLLMYEQIVHTRRGTETHLSSQSSCANGVKSKTKMSIFPRGGDLRTENLRPPPDR